MNAPIYNSFTQWYREGRLAGYVRRTKPSGGTLNLMEAIQPAGDVSDPAVPDLVLRQDYLGGGRVSCDMGGGRFEATGEKCGFYLAAPNFANTILNENGHQQLRSLSFPVAHWQQLFEEAADGAFSFDFPQLYAKTFTSQSIQSIIQHLWYLSDEEGAPSRLLAQAAGLEILAELCQLERSPFAPAKGGLAPWAERRCVELMHARLSEDISLDELAAEAQLSSFHFARMFKQSLGVPPRIYLTRLRIEKACEMLEYSDLPITEIALEVGYSSSQVLARVFLKHRRMSPTNYRRTVRDPVQSIAYR